MSYLLTVYCITYNHKDYIKDALDGFLKQITNFEFGIFVYDDASTDGTSDLIREYQGKYPSIINAYISPKNMYHSKERWPFISALLKKNCLRGKYIAFCEGDDYWTDPNKLQKQVDFMEINSDCSMTVHAEHVINYINNTEYDIHIGGCSRYLTPEEIITRCNGYVQMASFVYRSNDLIHDMKFYNEELGDYPRQLYELAVGNIFYFDDVMCVYRQGHQNSWTDKYVNDKWFALSSNLSLQAILNRFDEYTGYKYHKYVKKRFLQVLMDNVLFDNEIPFEEYIDYIYDKNQSGQIDTFHEDRIRIGKIVRCEYILSESLKKNLSLRRNLIFGCGKYSSYISRMLSFNGVDYDGYIVSDDQIAPQYVDNKKVWNLRDYPENYSEVNVIVGVNQSLKDTVLENISKYNIKNIYTPLWFDL